MPRQCARWLAMTWFLDSLKNPRLRPWVFFQLSRLCLRQTSRNAAIWHRKVRVQETV